MLAADAAFEAIGAGRQHDELAAYPAAFEKSWLRAELDKSRNFKQWFKKGRMLACSSPACGFAWMSWRPIRSTRMATSGGAGW